MDHCKSSKQPDQYEFLDLSDVDDDERTRLSTALQPAPAALLNSDVSQIVTAGIQFDPQYEYIQSNLNWPAVPYDEIHPQYPQLSCNSIVNLVDSSTNPNMTPHTTVSHQQPSQQQQQPPTTPAQNPLQSGPQQNANIPSHIAQAAQSQQHIYSQPPPNFVPHSGGMYQMVPSALPNVFVNNVTANVNLHGYMAHPPMQHYMSANAAPFIPGEMQQQQQVPSLHDQPQQQQQAGGTSSYIRGGMRGRSGRGRGVTRRDYGSRQQNTQEVQQPVVDQQALMQPNFYYYNPYYTPQHMPVGMPSAQHATGTPLYASNMVPTTYIPHPMYGYPNLIYPPMVPPEYSMIDGKVDDQSAENPMQQMWHPIQIEYADHQQIDPAMHAQHAEEFMQHDDMDDYNYNQNIDHNSPHMLSPMYKDDQQYQQLHISEEFVQQPMVHLSPQHQQIIEAQQQQLVVINQQHMQPPSPQHQQQFNDNLSGNEFQHPNNLEENRSTSSQQHDNDYHVSIDSFNNNIDDKDKPLVENLPSTVVVSEEVKVPVVTNLNNNLFKSSNSSNSIGSGGVTGSGGDSKSVESASVVPKPMQNSAVQVHSNAVVSAGDLNKLATSVIEKLNIKNDRATTKQSSSNTWNKKNTASVSVSAVPISYPPPPSLQTTVTRNNETTATNCKPTVPKSEHIPAKETKEQIVEAALPSVEQSPKTVTVSTTTNLANPQQTSVESRSVKVEVIPSLNNNTLIFNSSENIHSTIKSNVKEEPTTKTVASPSVTEPNVQAAAVPATPSTWADLFTNKVSYATRTHSDSTARKPIAKVSPFESSSNNNTPTNYTPEGSLSYSAASAQGLPTSSSNVSLTTGAQRKTISKATVAPSKQSTGNESSFKMGEFFQKYKVDNSSVSLRPRGLINRSNNCYMNASLQALVACPPFYNLIRSIPLQPPALRSKTSTPTVDAMVELINEFSHLPPGARLTQHKKGHKKEDIAYDLASDQPFEPTGIYKLWRPENEGRQEDAEEFLSFVLNKLNDEMLELKKLVEKPPVVEPAQNVSNGDVNGDTADDGTEWQLIGNKNKGSVTRSTDCGHTPLSDIFRGELRSRIQREGDHSSDEIQPFFTLQLNIEKAASVKEALENFVGKDQVDGVTCSKTNQEVMAWQQMTLQKLPVVLVLHLKWFDYLDSCTKILKTVEFPIELKIDSKIVSSKKYSQKQKQYKLFAVVYHDGKEASKGHYITDAFHCGYLCWLRYDDSSVKVITENSVLHPRVPRVPYLLYYRRSDTIGQQNNHK